jgi:phosphoglycolate phosphatase
MHYEHIIWDWNGTLLDDAWLCVEVMNGTLTRRGMMPVTLTSYAEYFRFPVKDYYADIGFDFATDPFEVLSDEFITGYDARKVECPLRAGSRDLLAEFASLPVPQTIISASKQAPLDEMLTHYQLVDFFESAHGLDNHHAHGKISIGQAWIAEQRVDPARVVMIGDTTHDVEVAQMIGIDVVLIYSAHQSLPRLHAAGVPVFETLADVRAYIYAR